MSQSAGSGYDLTVWKRPYHRLKLLWKTKSGVILKVQLNQKAGSVESKIWLDYYRKACLGFKATSLWWWKIEFS